MASSAAFSYLNLSSSSSHRFVKWPKRLTASRKMVSRASLADDTGLLEAAKYTVDKHIKSGMKVGLGSGQASTIAIQYLGRQLRAGALKDVVGIPMSATSASEAAKSGIPMDQYQQESSRVDFAFNDADIMEEGSLISVIGRHRLQGDESILQEKAILKAASDLVFIIKEKLYKSNVDGSVPVLVQSLNWMETAEEIDDLFIGDAEVWRRAVTGYAGPHGGDFPVVTIEGHHVLDVIFTSPIPNLADVADSLAKIKGVVDHGVICGIQCTAVVVSDNGVRIVDNLPKNVMKEL